MTDEERTNADLLDLITSAVATAVPGSELLRANEMIGGVSADVFDIEFETADGISRRAVFRSHRTFDSNMRSGNVMAKEFNVLQALFDHDFAAPEPYAYVESPTGRPSLLLEWIDGTTAVAGDQLERALPRLAETLVQLHNIDAGVSGVSALPMLGNPLTMTLQHLARSHATDPLINHIERRPPALGRRKPVLVHGDYWPGNILWNDDRLVAVIDWEDAAIGDPLADVATARLELLCQFGENAMQQFTTAYFAGAADIVDQMLPNDLFAWELYSSASALSSMGGWGLPAEEEAQRRRTTQQFFDVAAAALLE